VDALAQMLVETAAQGVGVLFSSHQLDLVEDVCQDVVIIDHGRIVLAGAVEELKAASSQRSLVVTVDGEPWIPDLSGATVTNRQDGQVRVLVDESVDLDAVLRQAEAAGAVTRFSFEPPSLTDLFRRAVGRQS
jgi:ABC-2 type transport system ATP-binding protein